MACPPFKLGNKTLSTDFGEARQKLEEQRLDLPGEEVLSSEMDLVLFADLEGQDKHPRHTHTRGL